MAVASLQLVSTPAVESPAVKRLQDEDQRRWDRFVEGCPEATPFHSTAWLRTLDRAFGFKSFSLYAERDGQITGILPLCSASNWIIGRSLMSTPFADYGGVCAEDESSTEALIGAAKELAASRNVDLLELRSRSAQLRPEFHRKHLYVSFRESLAASAEEQLKRFPRDTRYMIRRAEKVGIEFRKGLEQVPAFYELMAVSWRRFGTPILPRSFLASMIDEFQGAVDLTLGYHQEHPVVGVLSLIHGTTLWPHFAGALEEGKRLGANNLIYWELMKYAIARGLRHFDFGRSKQGTGAYRFKSSWNMPCKEMDYQVFMVGGKTVPDISPLNPKFKLATRVWSRLPLTATKWIGPHVVRWFP